MYDGQGRARFKKDFIPTRTLLKNKKTITFVLNHI